MMLLFQFIKKIPKIIKDSFFSFHIFCVILAIILLKINTITVERNMYLNLLSFVGIISAFFLLTFEKVEYRNLIKRYKENGRKLVNTFFGILIIQMVLLIIQYIGMIYANANPITGIEQFLLFLSIIYMGLGFILIVCTWHASISFEQTKDDNVDEGSIFIQKEDEE